MPFLGHTAPTPSILRTWPDYPERTLWKLRCWENWISWQQFWRDKKAPDLSEFLIFVNHRWGGGTWGFLNLREKFNEFLNQLLVFSAQARAVRIRMHFPYSSKEQVLKPNWRCWRNFIMKTIFFRIFLEVTYSSLIFVRADSATGVSEYLKFSEYFSYNLLSCSLLGCSKNRSCKKKFILLVIWPRITWNITVKSRIVKQMRFPSRGLVQRRVTL